MAALVCAELFRAGIETDFVGGFRKSEPILEFLIDRLGVSDGALLGLFGELLLLRALLQRANPADTREVIDGWQGWKPSLRDFVWGELGVEVKTTTRGNSTHEVQGVHQIEPARDYTKNPAESGLILVSLGARYGSPHENSHSVAGLVEAIVHRLMHAGAEDRTSLFLSRVREYFAEHGLGYDHSTMSDEPAFSRAIELVFARGYDMADEAVLVPRRSDLVPFAHVDLSSVRYKVDLPVTVNGNLNPTVGLQQVARRILGY